jgi:hypothetical protein
LKVFLSGINKNPQTNETRVGIKKPTQKNPKKPHKKPTKNGFFGFFGVFLNF